VAGYGRSTMSPLRLAAAARNSSRFCRAPSDPHLDRGFDRERMSGAVLGGIGPRGHRSRPQLRADVCTALQLPAHLAWRDGRDAPQRPLMAQRTRGHI
jgi:hypothetical protein